MLKRCFDFVVSLAALVVLSPLLAVIALAIKLTSPGPALYQGLRTGRYGRPFRILKFRTMIVDAEQRGGTSTADTDSRITPLGRTLRKLKLDELPQILNVLKGDMSLVGPRPEVEEYTKLYVGEEDKILSVRPGITDYSSIKFRSLGTILAESNDPDAYYRDAIRPVKNQLRLQYVYNQSFLEDLRILFFTVFIVLFPKGSTDIGIPKAGKN